MSVPSEKSVEIPAYIRHCSLTEGGIHIGAEFDRDSLAHASQKGRIEEIVVLQLLKSSLEGVEASSSIQELGRDEGPWQCRPDGADQPARHRRSA